VNLPTHGFLGLALLLILAPKDCYLFVLEDYISNMALNLNMCKTNSDMNTTQKSTTGSPATPAVSAILKDSFYLPDLCATQSILFLILIFELLAFVLVLSDTGLAEFSWTQLGLASLFVQWVALCSAGALCNLQKFLGSLSTAMGTTLAFALVMFITLIFSFVAVLVMRGDEVQWYDVTWEPVLRNMIISAIITGLALRYLYLQHQFVQQQHAELQSRIQALQSRIRPHFLFNSMNIIASLISVDPDMAEEVVEDLSVLFRASLSDTSGAQVPLREELDLCERYARIERLRLDDRLKVDWDIDVDASVIRIPLLTLQPLLENAIYHGIQPLAEGGTVRVSVFLEDNMVNLQITNPRGTGEKVHGSGNKMALENIRSRLLAIYGPQSRVSTKIDKTSYETLVQYPNISA
jgi:two-component system sensor histidine kinase AlgZ